MRRILRLIALVLAALIPGPPAAAQALQPLAGPWAFRAGDDPVWSAPRVDERGWERLSPDRPWGLQGHRGLEGGAWYRLQVDLPRTPPEGGWGLALGGVSGAYEVFADGRRLGGQGLMPPGWAGSALEPRPAWYPIPEEAVRDGRLVLALRVWQAPFAARRFPEAGGLLEAPRLGPAPRVAEDTALRLARLREQELPEDRRSWVLITAFALVALFQLQFWRQRPQVRESLWFGLMGTFMALRQLSFLHWEGPVLSTYEPRFRISWAVTALACGAFIQFLWPLLDRPIPRWLRVYQLLHPVYALAVLALPMTAAYAMVHVHHGNLFELPLFAAWVGVIAGGLRRGHPEARTIAAGAAVLAVATVGELGGYAGLWPRTEMVSWGFAAFVASMGIGLSNRFARVHAQLESLTGDLERKVTERTRQLEAAQERIAHLNASARNALHDLPGWASAMAQDLARALGARSLEVWGLDGPDARPLTDSKPEHPDFSGLHTLTLDPAHLEAQEELVLPVSGPTGELRAALVVRGKALAWTQEERRLLEGFATHLGGALDLQRLRLEVAQSEQRRAATREELIARGIELLMTCPACRRCYGHGHAHCDADGQLLSTPARPLPLCFQERYRLTRVLGEGAMGTVFEARDLRLERPVALKVLRPELFDQAAYRLRYELEARTLARIQHPGVVAVHDRGELEDGSEFLVMECLEGRTLRQTLDALGPGTPAQVASLLKQGAAALEAAHAVGVLHRDLKPENIFVVDTPEGLRFKLLDFGLAKPLEADGGLTQAGLVLGTPLYMAPEQMAAQPLDARADLYALAVVAFEAFTGRRLVRNGAFADIFMEVARTPAPPLSSEVAGLPEGLDAAFAQALAKDRERRPADAGAWAAAVAALMEACRLPGRRGWAAAGPGSFASAGAPTEAVPRPD